MISALLFSIIACSPESGSEDTAADTAAFDTAPRFLPYAEDGESVAQVDPPRYLGLWYEIATTPSQQQAACAGTTAEYSLIDEETIGVTNRCYVGGLDGRLNEIDATARPLDDSFARLMVDFGFGFEAPYTIVELVETPGEPPYSHAVVTSAGVQYWILSRTPEMPEELYQELLARIESAGSDSSRLIPTEQPVD